MMSSPPPPPLLLVLTQLMSVWIVDVDALSLSGANSSYARFPPWSGCMNASFSFDFRTTQPVPPPPHGVLLWYADDGGLTDFFAVMLTAPRDAVRLVLRLADDVDGNVDLSLGRSVNDGRWHHVEVRRLYCDEHVCLSVCPVA